MIDIKSIWDNQKPTGDIIIRTKIEAIPHLNCFAATNHITGQHLYVMSISKGIEIPELKNYKFKGVEIFLIEINDSVELNIYLLDNELKDIFSLFIQNILTDILDAITEKEALNLTLNVISKWKRLFDKINFQGLSVEQQKGLIGELLFIIYLIDNEQSAPKVLSSWAGPDFDDKDFSFGSTGMEVKFTSSKLPSIKISSERQLDTQNLKELFLVLYTAEEVNDDGFTLNSLILDIRKKLDQNIDMLSFFNERLLVIGYLDEGAEYYTKMYSLKNVFYFQIAEKFPKIVKSQIPLGVYNTSYFIELSALEEFIVEPELFIQKI